MSFHTDSTQNTKEEEEKGNGLTQSIQVVSEIIKKRSEKPRQSWFLYDKQKKEMEQQLNEMTLDKESKSTMEIESDHFFQDDAKN